MTISLKFDPDYAIHNKSVLVPVIDLHQPGENPLPEPIMTLYTDAILCLMSQGLNWLIIIGWELIIDNKQGSWWQNFHNLQL